MSSSVPAVPPHSDSSRRVPASQLPPSPAKRALVAFLVLLGIGLSVVQALFWSRGVWTAEASGYAIGGMLRSSGVAYLIAGRKKNRKPIVFGLIFVAISFFQLRSAIPSA